ncbi:unnamed protein product [Ectocarpus sp. 4 AP-2014]
MLLVQYPLVSHVTAENATPLGIINLPDRRLRGGPRRSAQFQEQRRRQRTSIPTGSDDECPSAIRFREEGYCHLHQRHGNRDDEEPQDWASKCPVLAVTA